MIHVCESVKNDNIDVASHCSATDLVRSHSAIARGRCDSCLLPPNEKWHRNEIQEESYHCCENMEILHAHTIDPRSDHKENYDGYNVPHEDNTN
jgi:hypothetical protein